MKQINAVVIDDEKKNVRILEHFLTTYCPQVQVVGKGFTATEASKVIDETQPELIFMDIMLDEGTGFDILDTIEHQKFKVIFVTAYDEFAIRAFNYNAIDYLLKPLSLDKLILAVNKAYAEVEKEWFTSRDQLSHLYDSMVQNNKLNFVAVPSWDKIEFLPIEDIIYLQSDGRYTNFHMANGKTIMASKNIGELESIVDRTQFFRIHKSYIVNLKHVAKIYKVDGIYCFMSNKDTLPIAKRRQESLNRFLKLK